MIGLRSGADDYVVKPFSPAELVARVDAVLRRVDPAPEKAPPIVHGDLEIDPAARRVFARGEEVDADAARVRPAAVPRAPSRPGVHAHAADGRRVAVRVLLRHVDGDRARAPAAREDRGGPRAAAPRADRVGRRLPVPAVSPQRSALLGLGAALAAAGAIAAVYGLRDGAADVRAARRARARPRWCSPTSRGRAGAGSARRGASSPRASRSRVGQLVVAVAAGVALMFVSAHDALVIGAVHRVRRRDRACARCSSWAAA